MKSQAAVTDILSSVIENLSQGLSYFDRNLELVVCNKRYLDLLGFPSWMGTPGTPIATFFRHNAERGEYGEGDIEELVAARVRLAREGKPHSFERERLDGTILRVRGAPVADGGFVTTYDDITELRRSQSALEQSNEHLDELVWERTGRLRAREEELSSKTSTLETILESVEYGISLFDRDLKLVAANSQAFKIMRLPLILREPGMEFESLVRLLAERWKQGDVDIAEQVRRRVDLAREFKAHQFVRELSDGRLIEITERPVEEGFVTTYVDVTEQKRFEELLQTNNAALVEKSSALEAILAALEHGIALFGNDLRLVAANTRAFELMKVPHEMNEPGRHFTEFLRVQAANGEFGDGDIDRIVAERAKAAASPEPYHDFRYRADGMIVEVSRRPIDIGFVATYRDVTEQKQFEALLQANNEELAEKTAALETILDTISYGISLFDKDLKLVAANPPAFDLMGVPEDYNRPGARFEDFIRYQVEHGELGPGDIEKTIAERVEAARNERAYASLRERSDGRIVEVVRRFIENGFVTTYRDVTEEKRLEALLRSTNEDLERRVQERTAELKRQLRETERAEAEMREAKKRAEQADMAKSDFLARMSHEIRTPLNGVIGLSRILSETDLTERQAEIVTKVLSSSDALLNIVNDVLDFAKIEAGRMEIEETPFSIPDILENVHSVHASKAEEKGLAFETAAGNAGMSRFLGDPHRIAQILNNYCSNAIKFTETGHVRVAVALGPEQNGYRTVQFSVEDSGIGMTKDEADRIFIAFNQADASTTRRYGGTGLGLAICRELATHMNGRVWLESALGQGSTFHFKLLLRTAPNEGSANLVEDRDWRAACAGMRVLLVEDNPINREIATVILEGAGVTVTPAEHGKQAVDLMLSDAPPAVDVVLMDLQMPEMDGHEATRHILADPRYRDLNVIALTAHAVAEEIQKSREAGMRDHITKPFEPETLFRRLALCRDR